MSSDPNQAPALIDVARQRRRLIIMLTIDAVCVVVALAAIAASFALHQRWLLWLFAAATLAGFAAQGWLIAGIAERRKP